MIKPSGILNEVEGVLQSAAQGKGISPRYLTAYQILERLPDTIKSQIISERGLPGEGSGNNYAAATVIAQAAQMLKEKNLVEIDYLDPEGLSFTINGQIVEAGYDLCAIYKWK